MIRVFGDVRFTTVTRVLIAVAVIPQTAFVSNALVDIATVHHAGAVSTRRVLGSADRAAGAAVREIVGQVRLATVDRLHVAIVFARRAHENAQIAPTIRDPVRPHRRLLAIRSHNAWASYGDGRDRGL